MRDAVVVAQPRIGPRQPGERRRAAGADHLLLFLVLEDDHDDVRELRDGADRLCGRTGESREQGERSGRSHTFSSTPRRRHTCTTTITTTIPSAPATAAYTPYRASPSAAAFPA